MLVRKSFQPVKKAHIVPRFYQLNFAVNDQVEVWMKKRQRFERRNVDTAGTRSKYYRRVRPDGSQIDDIEATLSVLEGEARGPLLELIEGEELTTSRKATIAQLLGMQLARGPHFYEDRTELWTNAIRDLGVDDFTPAARRQFGYDIEAIKRGVTERATHSTPATTSMLRVGSRLGSMLANMRWQLITAPEPWFAYSDHPVVLWPAGVTRTAPFARQQHGPGGAIEVRAPLSPTLAVVMTWHEMPDVDRTPVERGIAAEFNAFTIGQADEQWMHMPGAVPPITEGEFTPLGPRLDPTYDLAAFESSYRRRFITNRLRLDSGAVTPKHFPMLRYDLKPVSG